MPDTPDYQDGWTPEPQIEVEPGDPYRGSPTMPDTPRPGQPFHSVAGHFPYHQYPHPTDHSHEAAPMTPEQIAPVGLAYPKSANGTPLDHADDCAFAYGNSGYACYCFVPRAHLDTLTAAATKTRDRLAWWMWSEDDSGDSNDLVAAYDELRSILGPSTEEGVAATLAGEPHDA